MKHLNHHLKLLTFLLILLTQHLFGQKDQLFSIGKNDKVFSTIYNRNREIIVHVPVGDNLNVKSETYPVLFLLDGESLFTKTVGILDHLSSAYGGEKCPKMIIVGIKHPNRMKDLLPVISKDNPENNDKFTEFLEKELIPYIDKNYPTQPYRLLVGHSLGGLRAANTLMYHPGIFNSYIALDPSMGHDMNVWSFKTDEMLKKISFQNKSLFVAMAQTMPKGIDTSAIQKDTSGAARHMRAIMRFCNGINNYNVKGLNFNWKYYPNEAHSGVTFLGLYDGLNSIFSWYPTTDYKRISDPSVSAKAAVEIVTKNFEEISKNMGYKVLPGEASIIGITDYLSGKGMNDKAIAFAELNVKNYPGSAYAKYYLRELQLAKKKALSELLATTSAKEICALCIRESRKESPDYNISENGINVLGYQLFEEKKLEDALLIFKMNTEFYPEAGNTWDSYGECLMAMGNESEGLLAYKKAFEINPKNKYAEEIIRKYDKK